MTAAESSGRGAVGRRPGGGGGAEDDGDVDSEYDGAQRGRARPAGGTGRRRGTLTSASPTRQGSLLLDS